jgi:hypothetical protein
LPGKENVRGEGLDVCDVNVSCTDQPPNRPVRPPLAMQFSESSVFSERSKSIHVVHLLHGHRHAVPVWSHWKIVVHVVVVVMARPCFVLIRFRALWAADITAWVVERSPAVGWIWIRVCVDTARTREIWIRR